MFLLGSSPYKFQDSSRSGCIAESSRDTPRRNLGVYSEVVVVIVPSYVCFWCPRTRAAVRRVETNNFETSLGDQCS